MTKMIQNPIVDTISFSTNIKGAEGKRFTFVNELDECMTKDYVEDEDGDGPWFLMEINGKMLHLQIYKMENGQLYIWAFIMKKDKKGVWHHTNNSYDVDCFYDIEVKYKE